MAESFSFDDEPSPKRSKPRPSRRDEEGHGSSAFKTMLGGSLGCVAGVGVLIAGAIGVVIFISAIGKNAKNHDAANGIASPERKIYTRAEFKKIVVGKTPDEVLKAVGKPTSTQENGDRITWYYDDVTRDPVTEKLDVSVQLVFEFGRVARVNY